LSSISSITSSTQESAWASRFSAVGYHLRRNPLVLIGLMIVIAWLVITVIAPVISPYEPLKQNLADRLQSPNETYLMGTDELGRDIFSRVLWGAQITIPAGFAVIIIGSLLGTVVGAIAGYIGGLGDELLMRFTELFMAFPTIILALAVTAALGPDIKNAIIALVIVWWPSYARVVRGLVLEVKSQEYVESAHSIGAGGAYILFRTILPNCIAPAVILATLDIGNAIIVFASLSFIGLGPDPSSPEWGRMVSIGIDFFGQWWMWLFPGLAIATLVMALNFIGDGLRDILDPRLRGEA
jgi:peptide/nickel transport system permease protein